MNKSILLLGLAILTCSSVVAQQKTKRASQSDFAQGDAKSVYSKWLNEDVTYIITPEEKSAFIMLGTDGEREQFIEAFWRRRDPLPETSENEFRIQHYERFVYAVQNFAFGKMQGWQTDRGRIYITLGKPDDIAKSSSGEVWNYREDNTSFKFADSTGSGDLRLQQKP